MRADLPAGQAGEVLVRTLYSGVSRGTESLVFRGEVPPSQYEAMRAPFQEGDFPGPVKYGYASVGEVCEDSSPDGLAGRLVFCLYPHQDLYYVPARRVNLIPEGVPPARAVLAANMETAVTIAWDARPSVGDRVVVVGAGVVGLLAGWLCRHVPGSRVTAVDVNPGREAVARRLGLEFGTDLTEEGTADLVIHASGQPDGVRTALRAAGLEGTIIEASWHGSRSVPLPLGEQFHARRLTLRSSQVGRIPPAQAPRWNPVRRMILALELLRAPELDALITGESDFHELPEVLARLTYEPGDSLCHRIRYGAS